MYFFYKHSLHIHIIIIIILINWIIFSKVLLKRLERKLLYTAFWFVILFTIATLLLPLHFVFFFNFLHFSFFCLNLYFYFYFLTYENFILVFFLYKLSILFSKVYCSVGRSSFPLKYSYPISFIFFITLFCFY